MENNLKTIRSEADKQREVILANAYRDAEKTRGDGDAKSADIYAQAYGADTEFFTFTRSLNAYKQTFKGDGDMIVLQPDSDFFKYFKKTEITLNLARLTLESLI